MSIAIIISTHGYAAEQLLKTAEMLLGEQKNVGCIDFIPGENAETLIVKYQTQLSEMDCSDGVLFLVDTWGGSPFNAASRLMVEKTNYEIVTGVNIPMLIEVLMARDDGPSFDSLVLLAVKTGRDGVKAKKIAIPENTATVGKSFSTTTRRASDNHMKICLARIDDRLIHGQVVTRWTKETNITRIIVVNDEIAVDNVRKTLLVQVAPPGVTAHVVDVAKMGRIWTNTKYSNEKVMLLFTNPTDVVRLIEEGVNITSVNIGGMAFSHGKIQINNAVSVDENDIVAFKKLNDRGIELEVRKVSSDHKLKMMDLITKM